ncbi:hypothetical protein C8R47DRAFT_1200334 [Mycena vitilis]|nr:hypothetical protein C8R47DRAFT_1200334 [Mycena vitilis]
MNRVTFIRAFPAFRRPRSLPLTQAYKRSSLFWWQEHRGFRLGFFCTFLRISQGLFFGWRLYNTTTRFASSRPPAPPMPTPNPTAPPMPTSNPTDPARLPDIEVCAGGRRPTRNKRELSAARGKHWERRGDFDVVSGGRRGAAERCNTWFECNLSGSTSLCMQFDLALMLNYFVEPDRALGHFSSQRECGCFGSPGLDPALFLVRFGLLGFSLGITSNERAEVPVKMSAVVPAIRRTGWGVEFLTLAATVPGMSQKSDFAYKALRRLADL